MSRLNNVSAKGFLAVATAATLWGSNATISKALFNLQLNPLHLLQIRLGLGALILVAFLAMFKPALLRINLADLPYFIVLGVVGLTMVQLTYFYTISLTGVALAVFLQYLAPLFVTAYTVVLTRTRPAPRRLLGIAFGIFGSALLVLPVANGQLSLMGLLSGLASAFFLAFYTIWGKRKAGEYSGWTILAYGLTFAALFWSFFVPPWVAFGGGHSLNMHLAFIFLAIFSNIIPFGLYFLGLRYTDATTATVTAMLEPLVAAFTAWVFLQETLSVVQILGGVAILAAVYLAQKKPRRETDNVSQ